MRGSAGLGGGGRAHSHGVYPDIDELFQQQAQERSVARREALLHRQQVTIDRAMFAPIMDLRALMGIGPKVAEHTINSLPMVPFPSNEDMRLEGP